MNTNQLINSVKELFLNHNFELCEESSVGEELFNIFFIKKDFRVEVDFDANDNTLDLSLDRPSFWFNDSKVISSLEEVATAIEVFIKKIDDLIKEDDLLNKLTKVDCELFLKTGSYDGMSSGVIEYQGSLYYISSITNPYFKHKSSEDSKNRVWRHFYVYEMSKEELEKVVMSSLDWLRHINLTSLCKDWNPLHINTSEEESEHNKYFDGKYRYSFEPKNKPVMKLTLFY